MAEESTSGFQFLKYAASGRNRFVTGIALLAALGGFLFGYDTGVISGRCCSSRRTSRRHAGHLQDRGGHPDRRDHRRAASGYRRQTRSAGSGPSSSPASST